MKSIFTLLFTTLYLTMFSINWLPFGPQGIHANNILFGAGDSAYTVICTNQGVCVNNGPGYTWNMFTYSIPAWEAIPYDSSSVLLAMGNGSYSDGIYRYDLINNTFNVLAWVPFSTFIKYCPFNNTYYAGSRYYGLLSSVDGIQWDTVPFFKNRGCAAMDIYGQHIVVTQENNIYATYYSDDGGVTWTQSMSNIPIHDLSFDQNGTLYGVFTGQSNSSGLYLSHNFGHTCNMEYYIDNMNVVGFDVMGNLFTGFHGALPPYEGVAVYDTLSNYYSLLNAGLPNKNINRFKFNPVMSSIAIFVCTDSGVYLCNDYLTILNNNYPEDKSVKIYPNPAHEKIKIELTEKADIEIINQYGQIIENPGLVYSKSVLDISTLSAGVYFIKVTPDKALYKKRQGFIVKKFIKQ